MQIKIREFVFLNRWMSKLYQFISIEQVVIHPPYSFPIFNENDIIIPKAMETAIEIHSVYNSADLKVRNLPIEDRDCVFGMEKPLKRFARYSYMLQIQASLRTVIELSIYLQEQQLLAGM
jgi:hypothetical protein